jgi:hypothetical protein
MVTSILSFDNITTRGWIPVIFDRYLVWNNYNRRELLRGYPEIEEHQIEIVGAPQFDFYWRSAFMIDEAEWRNKLKISSDRKVILFGGTSQYVAMPETEIAIQIDRAIQEKRIVDDPLLLIRRHPNDPIERWEHVRINTKHVVWDDPWEQGKSLVHANIRPEDIAKLAATLKYCVVHVNASSTMTIDGAIFDRPQIGPAYDPNGNQAYTRVMRDLYVREHYVPITESGGLSVAFSPDQLIHAINEGLLQPEKFVSGRQKLVREICTFVDGQATNRVLSAVVTAALGQHSILQKEQESLS